MTVTKEKLARMIELQDRMNSVINPNWREAGNNWLRASWIECAELMDWIGWKWWRKQDINLTQAQIELVDIWHFLLSQAILEDLGAEELMGSFLEEVKKEEQARFVDVTTPLQWVEELARCVLNEGVFYDYYTVFAIVCDKLDLSFDELYRLYVGKNVLNIFRQDHGYKEGTYIKQWKSPIDLSGLIEDNVYLEMFMEEALRDEPEDIYTYLYDKLEIEYNTNL